MNKDTKIDTETLKYTIAFGAGALSVYLLNKLYANGRYYIMLAVCFILTGFVCVSWLFPKIERKLK